MTNVHPSHPLLDLHPEVAQALAAGAPVVALESTLIAHGMPWPHNLQTARRLEAEVRAHGAVPATIAVLGGRLKAGLGDADLQALAQRGPQIAKLSRRDLAACVARGEDGATTVAATMIVAALAGIRVFATGGIGGVHRGAGESFDISADLLELAQTPVAVVCAGAKSILDLGLTLEVLETHGVPVVGYGTDTLPAFYVRDSGIALPQRVDGPQAAARLMHAQWALGLKAGLVFANPIPPEHALPRERVDAAIARALADAQAQGIRGKASTPFLLQRVSELTGGDSLAANLALVLNNAAVAAQVAAADARL
ncbi:MAG: pseudouridine-5'-phosphate glycosidase [Proteobacteria bacterium]|nr:pseudouridine-5'-phosphate glycosidase [Pseudomonadota bacterium]